MLVNLLITVFVPSALGKVGSDAVFGPGSWLAMAGQRTT